MTPGKRQAAPAERCEHDGGFSGAGGSCSRRQCDARGRRAGARRPSIATTPLPPGIDESIVSSARSILGAGSGRAIKNIVAVILSSPASVRAMTVPTLAPFAPVMDAFRPSTTQWLPSSWTMVRIIGGSKPALLLPKRTNPPHKIHVALVGRHRVACKGAKRRQA